MNIKIFGNPPNKIFNGCITKGTFGSALFFFPLFLSNSLKLILNIRIRQCDKMQISKPIFQYIKKKERYIGFICVLFGSSCILIIPVFIFRFLLFLLTC